MKRSVTLAFAAAILAAPAFADDVTDTLQSAIQAYEEGDIQYALEEIAFAQQLLNEMKSDQLRNFLPEAPAGWERRIDEDRTAGMSAFGGGIGSAAVYMKDDERFTLTIMADSPMVASMAGIFGNSALLNSQGRLVRVGREKFLEQDDQLTGIVDGRIMVQADGADTDTMIGIIELIDFRALGRFGL